MRRATFVLSYKHGTSFDMGQLIPIGLEEVLPGDTFIQSGRAYIRVAPLINPLMHRVEARIHYWYVPNRIVWASWEKFITGEETTLIPEIAADGVYDYMGAPTGVTVSQLPVRGYNMIWNNFYRDQDLQPEVSQTDKLVKRIAWQKDYFTVARPSPQQGDPVGIDGNIFPAYRTEQVIGNIGGNGNVERYDTATESWVSDSGGNNRAAIYVGGAPPGINIDINDLRRSLAFQRMAEARAKHGSRYKDYLKFLGVNPSDGRLDLPEYLGGSKQTLSFSEVLATAEGANTAVGDMSGHGIGIVQTPRYRRMFEEHGYVFCLLSLRPKAVYQDSVPKHFLRKENTDYWQKEFEVLPWQAVTEQEVHKDGDPNKTFGYVPNFEEYRHGMSRVSATLRGGTEDAWTMARQFATPPALNGSFVECTPTDRIYSDANMPDVIVDTHQSITARRLVAAQAGIGGL